MILCFKSRIFTLRMKSALFAVFVFPPPAAGANVFAGRYGARAGLATDGRKAFRVQRIDGDLVGRDVVLERGERPVRDRIELDELLRRVIRREVHVGAAL